MQNNETNYTPINSSSVSFTSDSENNFDKIDSSLDVSLALTNLALHHNLTHSALGDILKFLRKYTNLTMLPKDPRTLLKTPPKTEVSNIDGGVNLVSALEIKLN